MRAWTAERVALAAGATVVRGAPAGPRRAVVDSREIRPGDLFVGLPGARVDGGDFAEAALEAGAWGVLVDPERAAALGAGAPGGGAVLAAARPLAALASLARSWRRELGAAVIAVTGSVGKTSTKDLLGAMLAPHCPVAVSRANFNTEIGLPLELLAAPPETEVLVLELAMRGAGQIAELTAICEPDVGVITNVGPVHLEQLGSLEGVARAKAELLVGMRDGAVAVVPAGEPRLEPFLRSGLRVTRFGPGGDVRALAGEPPAILAHGERLSLELPFSAAHHMANALAAVGACLAIGVRPEGRVEVAFSALRGERVALPLGATVINDCYNANPLSMRAALEDLATHAPEGRRVAVLGDMLELGPGEREHHLEVGALAARAGVELLIAVGRRAAAMVEGFEGAPTGAALPGRAPSAAPPVAATHLAADAAEAAELARELLRPGDLVLVKGSRGVGLERVAEALVAGEAER